jgi:hypothetical protein
MLNLNYIEINYHLLKISKKKYCNEYFIKNSKDSKKVWKGIKEIVKSGPQQFKCTKIMNGNQEISDPNLLQIFLIIIFQMLVRILQIQYQLFKTLQLNT